MERPKSEMEPGQRDITGEIVYLDEMRRHNQEPKPFLELSDMAIQMYETEADMYRMYAGDKRPVIMDEYEQYDSKSSEIVASCVALADELIALKEAGSRLTYVNISVEASPSTVLEKLRYISAGTMLSEEAEQLAIPSDGTYYPILDIRKQNAELVSVGLRVWGWDDTKYVFTNKDGEPYEYPKHALVFPSNEKSSTRQLELSFGYKDATAGEFSESISLYLSADGSAAISSNIWAMAYAETGYEGHAGSSLHNLTDDDIAAFGDLIAEIVGDTPMSVSAKIEQQLLKLTDTAATPSAKQAICDLIEATWPAQASYLLNTLVDDEDQTLAQQLCDKTTADTTAEKVNAITKEWEARRQKRNSNTARLALFQL